jgi:hypothetical protein
MKRVTDKIKPVSGFSHIVHLLLTVVLPLSVYVLIRLNLVQLAIALVILSKWRIFSVRPRYWLPLVRANAVDLIVGISTIIFMINTSSGLIQLIWAVAYAMWLILIKPSSSVFGISMQAFVAFLYGLVAVYLEWGGSTAVILMIMTWIVCYSVARHFFTSFNETHSAFLSNAWAFFGASLTWILSFWLLYYQAFSQVTLLLIVLGFGLATLYYLDQTDRLSKLLRRQIIFVMIAVVFVTLVFSDWGDKII